MFVSVYYVCSISDKQDFREIMSLNVSSSVDGGLICLSWLMIYISGRWSHLFMLEEVYIQFYGIFA